MFWDSGRKLENQADAGQEERVNSEKSQTGNQTHNLLANHCATMSPPQVGLKEVEDILRDVDLNGDGLVDFEGNAMVVHLALLLLPLPPHPPPSLLPLYRVRTDDVTLRWAQATLRT